MKKGEKALKYADLVWGDWENTFWQNVLNWVQKMNYFRLDGRLT